MTTGKHFLLASDFDQTLSFNDSADPQRTDRVTDFQGKVEGLAASNLVQQGGELAYLIRHDPGSAACAASICRGRPPRPPAQ